MTQEITSGWLMELHAMEYNHAASTACELWCKFGDWSGQSVDRTLDFQWVFCPTKAQQLQAMENARAQGYVVMTADQARTAFNYQGAGKVSLEIEKPRSDDSGSQKPLSAEWQEAEKAMNGLFRRHGCE